MSVTHTHTLLIEHSS